MRGTSIALSEDLPGVARSTIFAIGDIPSKDNIRDLELTGFSKLADKTFASVVAKLPSLRKLNLRHCRFIQPSMQPIFNAELAEAVPKLVQTLLLLRQTIARNSRLPTSTILLFLPPL